MSSVNLSDLPVIRLKEILKEFELSTAGSKAELIVKLTEADPSGDRLRASIKKMQGSGSDRDVEDRESDIEYMRRQNELLSREKELAERELEIARREILMLNQMQQLNVSGSTQSSATENIGRLVERPKMNITTIADLLSYFDGGCNTYERWEKQVRLLRSTYNLQDDSSKILIGSRLKGKALDWFYSRPEFIDMPTEEFLAEMRSMFHHRPSKMAIRKHFEDRVWRRGETFNEFYHEKVILANHVPIPEDEIIDYIIAGIPDPVLRDQARIQRFDSKAALLEAFEEVTLRCKTNGVNDVKNSDKRQFRREESGPRSQPRSDAATKRCHSCGSKDHLVMSCPTKDKGTKCFECRGFGHIASNCPKKTASEVKDSCTVSQTSGSKYYKEVTIKDRKVTAVIDTGSDLCLMRADTYIEIGTPPLIRNRISFNGIGSSNNRTLGEFTTSVTVDNEEYPISIHVVSDRLMNHELLIGTDFLNKVEMTMSAGNVSIRKPSMPESTDFNVPEVFQISVCKKDEVDVSHDLRREVQNEGHIESENSDSKVESNFMFKNLSRKVSSDNNESSKDSIDSDVAKEYSLSRSSTSKFSDDDIPGHECRASELESSDPDVDRSDLKDFVDDDDDEEIIETDSDNDINEGENPTDTQEFLEDIDITIADIDDKINKDTQQLTDGIGDIIGSYNKKRIRFKKKVIKDDEISEGEEQQGAQDLMNNTDNIIDDKTESNKSNKKSCEKYKEVYDTSEVRCHFSGRPSVGSGKYTIASVRD